MRWIEATVTTQSAEIDDVCAALAGLGVSGMSIEDEQDFKAFLENNRQYWDYVDAELEEKYRGLSRVKFYLNDDAEGRAALERIRTALGREIGASVMEEADWENGWRQCYQPIEIGQRLLVLPEWLEAETEGRAVLRLEPGLAFGTGSHATTRMCLEVLDSLDLEGKTVLDLGCGSGILGIGALVLGAKGVKGCDVDPNAPAAARENAALNGIGADRFDVRAGDLLADEGLRRSLGTDYDLVLANIVADVIIPLSGFARRFMADGGLLVCSGIIENRAAEVEAALTRNGFHILRRLQEEEWSCYVCK